MDKGNITWKREYSQVLRRLAVCQMYIRLRIKEPIIKVMIWLSNSSDIK